MSAAVATRGVIRSQIEWGRCSHCTWMPSEPDDDAALEHALPGGRRGTSSTGAGGRGVSAFDLLQGAGQDPRWRRSRPSLGARSSAHGVEARKDPHRLAECRLGHSVPHAQRSARASETQTAAALFDFDTVIRCRSIYRFLHDSSRPLSLDFAQ